MYWCRRTALAFKQKKKKTKSFSKTEELTSFVSKLDRYAAQIRDFPVSNYDVLLSNHLFKAFRDSSFFKTSKCGNLTDGFTFISRILWAAGKYLRWTTKSKEERRRTVAHKTKISGFILSLNYSNVIRSQNKWWGNQSSYSLFR